MSKLLSLSIDVSKITKDKLISGKKGTYLNLTVALNDQEDNYGNTVSCWESTKDRSEPKNYLGNGKVIWESETTERPNESFEPSTDMEEEDTDSLPF